VSKKKKNRALERENLKARKRRKGMQNEEEKLEG
jgi:hypothetical protein